MASKMEVGVRLVTTEAVNSFLVFTSGGENGRPTASPAHSLWSRLPLGEGSRLLFSIHTGKVELPFLFSPVLALDVCLSDDGVGKKGGVWSVTAGII